MINYDAQDAMILFRIWYLPKNLRTGKRGRFRKHIQTLKKRLYHLENLELANLMTEDITADEASSCNNERLKKWINLPKRKSLMSEVGV